MRMMNVKYNDQMSGVSDSSSFGGVSDAKIAFVLMSGIAADKIGYPVREICTNAWEAGAGRFHVSTPTRFSPTFRVRDYGPGLSHDFMMKEYVKFGMSTKDSDENAVGGWGLGSKSPFAYVIGDSGSGSFNVRSFQNGEVRTYVMSIAEGGMPKISHLDTSPTDEPDGIEVAVPVRKEDVSTFERRVEEILWFFNPRPTMDIVPWGEPKVIASGEGWTEYASGSVPFNTAHVRMGCVGYEIDFERLPGIRDRMGIGKRPVVLDVPIGSVKVTASRENLQYTDLTVSTLKAAIEKLEQEWVKTVVDDFGSKPTWLDAAKAFYAITSDYRMGARRELVEKAKPKWKGLPVTITLDLGDKTKIGEGSVNGLHRVAAGRFYGDERVMTLTDMGRSHIFVDSRPMGAIDRIATLKLPENTEFTWIRCDKASEVTAILDKHGIAYTLLDDVPDPKKKPQLFYFYERGKKISKARFDTDEPYYYIEVNHYGRREGWRSPKFANDYHHWNNIDKMLDLMPDVERLVCIPVGEEIPEAFQDFFAAVRPLVEAKIDWTPITYRNVIEDPFRNVVGKILNPTSQVRWPKDIKDVASDINRFNQLIGSKWDDDTVKYHPLYVALTPVEERKQHEEKTNAHLVDKIKQLHQKYPALRYLIEQGVSRYYGSYYHSSERINPKVVDVLNHYFDLIQNQKGQ